MTDTLDLGPGEPKMCLASKNGLQKFQPKTLLSLYCGTRKVKSNTLCTK